MNLIFILILSLTVNAQILYGPQELPAVQQDLLKKVAPIDYSAIIFFDYLIGDQAQFPVTMRGHAKYIFKSPMGRQYIQISDDLAQGVLECSTIETSPIECLTISGNVEGRRVHYQDYYSDHKLSSISRNTVDKAIEDFIQKVMKEYNHEPTDITLTHSHPVYEAIFYKAGIENRKILTTEDLNMARLLSKRFGFPVEIQAVLPNGYTYSARFVDGLNISI